MTKREQVARGIWTARYGDGKNGTWDEAVAHRADIMARYPTMGPGWVEWVYRDADAALAAMVEPTEGMIREARIPIEMGITYVMAQHIWRAMIAEARKP